MDIFREKPELRSLAAMSLRARRKELLVEITIVRERKSQLAKPVLHPTIQTIS